MSIKEIRCNGEAKQEVLSSSEGMLTYRRRKRMRTGGGEPIRPQGDAPVSADEKVNVVGFLFKIIMVRIIV